MLQLRLLLDEDTERRLAELLANADHDVERVVDVPGLGPGSDDPDVRRYARNENRIVLCYDDDHAKESGHDPRVFWCPNKRLSAFEVFQIVQQVAQSYPSVDQLPPTVYLTGDWLP